MLCWNQAETTTASESCGWLNDRWIDELPVKSRRLRGQTKAATPSLGKPAQVLLKELMQQGLPGCQVDVHVVVRPASRSDVLLDGGVVDSHDDIVLEDFTVNDQRGAAVSQDGRLNDTRILTSVIAGHEVLAQSGCG